MYFDSNLMEARPFITAGTQMSGTTSPPPGQAVEGH
jgi:hypothetical protein